MTENTERRMTDPSVVPDDAIIKSLVGDKFALWDSVLSEAMATYSGISGEWRYYNDGKQWLFKMVLKKKTIFWASVLNDSFRVTFYFGGKYEDQVINSGIPSGLKKDFAEHKGFGKIKPVTVTLTEQADVNTVLELIGLKSKLK